MIWYVTVLKALAACLITNSHYEGIYPLSIFANGGLLGDVLFFSVSGFCLYNIPKKFLPWYGKRIFRIYPAVWMITILYLLLGFYDFYERGGVGWFLYPTGYHFVASIMVLYLFYFVVRKFENHWGTFLKQSAMVPCGSCRITMTRLILAAVVVLQMIAYLFYDASYYHIDTVREPMIRFLYFEAMLLGVHFRESGEKYEKKKAGISFFVTLILFIVYFSSKLLFVRYEELSGFQIVNQWILLALLYFIWHSFAAAGERMELILLSNALGRRLKKMIAGIAQITLEIYLVQNAIISNIPQGIRFPINWFVVTGMILMAAALLHWAVRFLNLSIDKVWVRGKSLKRGIIEKSSH